MNHNMCRNLSANSHRPQGSLRDGATLDAQPAGCCRKSCLSLVPVQECQSARTHVLTERQTHWLICCR